MGAKVGGSAGWGKSIAAILPGMPVKGGHGAVNGSGWAEGEVVVGEDGEQGGEAGGAVRGGRRVKWGGCRRERVLPFR
jgi:hypothetical protein